MTCSDLDPAATHSFSLVSLPSALYVSVTALCLLEPSVPVVAAVAALCLPELFNECVFFSAELTMLYLERWWLDISWLRDRTSLLAALSTM